MPRMTQLEYDAYNARRSRLRPVNPQSVERGALVSALQRKAKSGNRAADMSEPKGRFRIRFTVYAVRPCDWDGYSIKALQDLLIKAGILDNDDWASLQGEVVSEKAYTKETERTQIELTPA